MKRDHFGQSEGQTMDDVNSDQETSAEKTAEPAKRRVSRRGLIAKGAAVAAGGVGLAALAADPAHATVGAMQYGTLMNAQNSPTTLQSDNPDWTLFVSNSGGGQALRALATGDAITAKGLYAEGWVGVDARGRTIGIRAGTQPTAGPPSVPGAVQLHLVPGPTAGGADARHA